MPYLRPETVLRRFSGFTLSTIRPAIPDDEEFVRGQAGSMASTLRFLAGELEARERMVDEQERALREALEDVASVVADCDGGERVTTAVEEARETIEEPTETTRERETGLLEAADDVLAAVDDLDDQAARDARRPLYDFLDTRVEGQLRALGRDPEEDDA